MYWKVIVILSLSVYVGATETKCDYEDSVDISGGERFSNGDILYKGITYTKFEYFKDNETNSERGCICRKKRCIRKCCGIGLAYNGKEKKCLNTTEEFNPVIYDESSLQVQNSTASDVFHLKFNKVVCIPKKEARLIVSRLTNKFHLRMNGDLYIEMQKGGHTLAPDKYCIDNFVFKNLNGSDNIRSDALICFPLDQDKHDFELSSSCMLISCVFILATVAVYAWLPELRNLPGRVLIAYLLCLFVGFLFLAIMQILLIDDNISLNCCVIFSFIIYFSLLAAFFWLNVMCFDIWWTFSGKRRMQQEKLSIRARFCVYTLYAFGVPTALTVLLAGLQFSGVPRHPLLPMIGYHGCFLGGIGKLLYFYGPILILCVANITFFILTALKIVQIEQQTSVLKSQESAINIQQNKDKQRLLLYVKLFVVMGLSWLLEIASALYKHPAWRYTDAYNILIGLFIFILFVCKPKIFQLIKKRYQQMRGTNVEK